MIRRIAAIHHLFSFHHTTKDDTVDFWQRIADHIPGVTGTGNTPFARFTNPLTSALNVVN